MCGWNGVYFSGLRVYEWGIIFASKVYQWGIFFTQKVYQWVKYMNGYNFRYKCIWIGLFLTSPSIWSGLGPGLQPHIRTKNHGKLPPPPPWVFLTYVYIEINMHKVIGVKAGFGLCHSLWSSNQRSELPPGSWFALLLLFGPAVILITAGRILTILLTGHCTDVYNVSYSLLYSILTYSRTDNAWI